MNILEQVNDDWWWAECDGSHGYVPSNHLVERLPEQWENEEYFDSYSQLVSSVTDGHTVFPYPAHKRNMQFSNTRQFNSVYVQIFEGQILLFSRVICHP